MIEKMTSLKNGSKPIIELMY